jgi:hypothetical protein
MLEKARVNKFNENEIDEWKFVPTVTSDESGRVVTPKQLDGFNCGVIIQF